MTEADEFRKSAELSRRRQLHERLERAWNEGFATGFIIAVIMCLIILLFLKAIS